MEEFIHQRNIARYQRLLMEKLDESTRRMVLKLLTEEAAKDIEHLAPSRR